MPVTGMESLILLYMIMQPMIQYSALKHLVAGKSGASRRIQVTNGKLNLFYHSFYTIASLGG
jgi:hypothetical protein